MNDDQHYQDFLAPKTKLESQVPLLVLQLALAVVR